jgi:tRNA-binding EMAP/Myf-like protein
MADKDYTGFKVGAILELEDISEKLKLLSVDVGGDAPLSIVTNVSGSIVSG